ncbi:MAG: hypothetical protein CVV24_04235 [Ignavibacteriae bacterium HGW-Ignavibacteriae-3]|nr:MAG: hypothetical protein CVV24_04235 [Ignavibacteriae bacterium HGW-Ignavibacteriae-3]
MRKRHKPNIRFLITSYFFVLLTAAFFIYGVYWFINVPVEEKVEKYRLEKLKKQTGVDESAYSLLPLILDRREGCVTCHNGTLGFTDSHSPGKIGCYSCHLGDRLTTEKNKAHKDMILIPGNSNDAAITCGAVGCHPQMVPRMDNNIMNTMNGVVSVDKWVFDEAVSPTFRAPIDSIKYSPAETHLRNLCASCHLANVKSELGPIVDLSRGGGCLACHLNYSKEAEEELAMLLIDKRKNYELGRKDKKEGTIGKFHPSISLKTKNQHCFGCHSRSGRISLSYDGWHETLYKPEDVKGKIGFKLLDDGRVVQQIQKDVHSEAGLLCVDCHTSYEIMGDGIYTLHKEDQMKVQCIDCHILSEPTTQKFSEFEFESQKIAELKKYNDKNKNFIVSAKNGFPLVNVYYEDGKVYLIKKSSGKISEVKTPSGACTKGTAHKNLSCNSCHNSWSPQCIGCHTEFDKDSSMYDLLSNKEEKGEWLEHPSEFLPEPATLGIKETYENGIKKITVEEFIPGMILKIDKGRSKNQKPVFKRLFAPGFSHTIRKQTRSCTSCHNNSLAIGYGRGKLIYKKNGSSGLWNFIPAYALIKDDGLPQDAWIGFLEERSFNSTTRNNTRPFSIDEQRKILTVAACLTCHPGDSWVMKNSLLNFPKTLTQQTAYCLLPVW